MAKGKIRADLANCPFCGSDKVKITSISKGASKGSYYQGLCNKCYARGPKTSDEQEAIYKWNERAFNIFIPTFRVNKYQFKRFIDGEILIRCHTINEFSTLINACVGVVPNVKSLKDWWYCWFKYKADTVVIPRSSIVDANKLWIGFTCTPDVPELDYTMPIEDIQLTL